jgi:transposase-like protein
VRLVLEEGLSQTATAKRLKVTQRSVARWLEQHKLGKLAPGDAPVLDELATQLRALEAVSAAWRQVFAPSDP